jgi:hypothetical protein
MRGVRIWTMGWTAVAVLWLFPPVPAWGGFIMGKTEALEQAFPGATRIDRKNVFLTEEQVGELTRMGRSPWEGRVVTYYAAFRETTLLGYALVDTHRVRTKTETALVSVTPEGRVGGVFMMAFFEPDEYMATERWLGQLIGRGLEDGFGIRREIDVITGATLTSEAMSVLVRKALAFYEVILQKPPTS